MLKKFFKIVLPVLLTILIFGIFNFLNQKPEPVQAGISDNVSGYAWSDNIGWISFNNTSGGGSSFGVNINTTAGNNRGKFSGYAWSDNIGWISFNEADTGAPPANDPCSNNSCIAKAESPSQLGKSNVNILGWARALSYGGGWDGWIRFDHGQANPVYIDSVGNFHGWAWGSDVVGWINFYNVVLNLSGLNQPPNAKISCDASACSGGTCNGATWIAFQPLADPTPCLYTIKNDSTDPDNNIVSSAWFVNNTSKLTCPPGPIICNYTLQSDVAPGDYTVKLQVTDSDGLSNDTTHSLTMKSEVRAGFMCSADNINWQACETFSNKISQGELVYLKDDSSLAEYSAASQGAAITLRQWKINSVVFDGSSVNPSVNLTSVSNVIRLTVTDSAGRIDYQEHTIGASLPLPEWKEIPPFLN